MVLREGLNELFELFLLDKAKKRVVKARQFL